MRRRDFVATSIGVLGGVATRFARGAVPCPMPTVKVDSDAEIKTGCAFDAESDWLARSQAPGVVWAHDFRTDKEITDWLWSSGIGDDPNRVGPGAKLVTREPSDGITGGGCLQYMQGATFNNTSGWWRPFSPASDLGPPVQGSSRINVWHNGNYAHASYNPDGGNEFYIQFRLKLDPNLKNIDTGAGGKIAFIGRTESTPNQEIVVWHPGPTGERAFNMYSQFGGNFLTGAHVYSPWPDAHDWQPGSDYGLCLTPDANDGTVPATCWRYPYGEWHTYLIKIVPGIFGSTVSPTGITVWAARAGAQSYTKIWDRSNYQINGGSLFNGWNSFLPSIYYNDWTGGTQWYQRYDQIIFSTQFIACPAV